MDWTAGYASDVEYVTGFYREQSPSWLNFVCLLNGCEPIALDRPYTYCELGFGRGSTAQVLAAGNPNGRFFAADFNPAHVAGAARLAAQAQLDNLQLLENSFEELASGCVDLPGFDFITLHGVYTWVSGDNRRHIVNFINRYLKPGGVVYISYNAMPGWAVALPLQRLLLEYADLFPNRSDLQIQGANELIQVLERAQARYLTQNPALAVRTSNLRTADTNYLVHEYMHRTWCPMFHADVARDLASAKMTFVGSADLPFAYPALYLNDEMAALLAQITQPETRETLQDYYLNTAFRKDVFVRGANRIGPVRQAELLEQLTLVLTVPRAVATADIQLSVGEFAGNTDVYEAVLDAIAARPHTLAELVKLPGLGLLGIQDLAQVAVLLCSSNQASFYFSSGAGLNGDAARRLNRTLSLQVRYGEEHAALCSPLLGNGVTASLVERLFYLALAENGGDDPAALARYAWQTMAPVRRRMLRNGTAECSVLDKLPELKILAERFVSEKLPVWRSLKII